MSQPLRAVARPLALYSFQAVLLAFPFVCFTLALLTDIAFWRSANLLWQDFSAWLLFAGLAVGGLALLNAVLQFFLRGRERRPVPWLFVIGGLIVLLLAFINSLVHARDGWTAVVPTGVSLSALTFVVMIVVALVGRTARFGGAVEVYNHA
jgi:uncharacterized membrane protein